MTLRQTSIHIPDYGPATLTLPDVLSADLLKRLEAAMQQWLGRELCTKAVNDPGAIEFDSWSIHLH